MLASKQPFRMQKTFIRNRKRQKIAVLVEQASSPVGLVFVMHGLGGFKEQPHIQLVSGVFKENGYTVVRFDTTNTLGESAGSYQYATVTNYSNDLEDVIAWAKKQDWYKEPYILAAHNMGGMCIAMYAAQHPREVKALAPIATLVSGPLSLKALEKKENVGAWKATGWLVRESRSIPGTIKRLKWSHMEDRMRYDLLPFARSLTMPVLMVVGDQDYITPPAHQRLLFDALPGPKEFHVLKNGSHRFRDEINLRVLRTILNDWVGRVTRYRPTVKIRPPEFARVSDTSRVS